MYLIGLTGTARHGKDTVYTILVEIFLRYTQAKGLPPADIPPATFIRRYAIADRLKMEVAAAWGVTLEEINANKDFWRPLLQAWGNTKRVTHGENCWLDQVEHQIEKDRPQIAIITDVSYPNEFAWCRVKYAGVVWRVLRPGVPAPNNHATEHGRANEPVEYTIVNDGTINDLRIAVAVALDEWTNRYHDIPPANGARTEAAASSAGAPSA
jgi:hypothetical protein